MSANGNNTLKITHMLGGLLAGIILVLFIYVSGQGENNNTVNNEGNTTKEEDLNCEGNYAPVCGEDLISYTNECEAERAGVNIKFEGFCEDSEKSEITLKQTCENECCENSVDEIINNGFKIIDENGECQTGYTKNNMGCVGSYSWCEKIQGYSAEADLYSNENNNLNLDEEENEEEELDENEITESSSGERLEEYYQETLKYGFSMPYGNYYESLGGVNDSVHTIGIKWGESLEGDINNADIIVYLYSKFRTKSQVEEIFKDNENTIKIIEKNGRLAVIEVINNTKNTVEMIEDTIKLEKLD